MYWGFRPYVSVAKRREQAKKTAAKMTKKGEKVSPINIEGRTIAKTFWGKAWCDHLESFSDYENRLPRGRSYVRNGSVIHLGIEKGKIEALVQGSSLYKVKIDIKEVANQKWQEISKNCSGQIGSVIELLQGKLSSSVMKIISDKQKGLFPQPKEITLSCSCPDWADMCKHVAAVLYGVGAKLDESPEFLFQLRHVDHLDLISKANIQVSTKQRGKAKVIKDQDLSNLFGIEIETKTSSTSSTQKQKKTLLKPIRKKTKSLTKNKKSIKGISSKKKN